MDAIDEQGRLWNQAFKDGIAEGRHQERAHIIELLRDDIIPYLRASGSRFADGAEMVMEALARNCTDPEMARAIGIDAVNCRRQRIMEES